MPALAFIEETTWYMVANVLGSWADFVSFAPLSWHCSSLLDRESSALLKKHRVQ